MSTKPWPEQAVSVSHVGDLIVVRENSVTYVAAEIAHIDNILDGEFHERKHSRATTLEISETRESEEETESERDLQTTEKFELARETQETLKERSELKAGAKLTAQYGNQSMGPFVKAEGEIGYTSTSESERSQRSSSRFSKEIVERSLERIKSRLKEVRLRRTVEEVKEESTHRRDNPAGYGNQSGVYRWVDKVYSLQRYNYGRRLFLDIYVPDPGANLRTLERFEAPGGISVPRPADFVITVDDVTEELIADYLTLWNADVSPAPPEWVTVAHTARMKGDPMILEAVPSTVRIPQGYWVVQAEAVAEMSSGSAQHVFSMRVSVGDAIVGLARRNPRSIFPSDLIRGPEIPVAVYGYLHHESAVAVSILCQRAEAYRAWQLDTYQALYQAYLAQKSAYEEALANARFSRGGVTGSNPALNRNRERDELARSCIELLRRQHYAAMGLMDVTAASPQFNFANVDGAVTTVSFFSEAFDWDNLGFELIPYYWSDPAEWGPIMSQDDPDPAHEQFLKAGWAQVSVPVRPGYEGAVLYFVDNAGIIWNEEADPPQRADREALIGLLQDSDARLGVERLPQAEGSPWDVRLPTELIVLDTAALPAGAIALF